MGNATVLLGEIRRLMQLKGENHFKVVAFEKAAEALEGRDDLAERAQAGTLKEIPGVGRGIEQILIEFFRDGRSSVKEDLEKSLPQGLIELTEIPGLGPKKALAL